MNWVWLTHHHVPTSELSLVTGSLAQLVEHQAGNLRLWVQFPHEATFSCLWFFPPGGLQILRLSSLGCFSEQTFLQTENVLTMLLPCQNRDLTNIRYWRTCMTWWIGFRYKIHVFVQCAVFYQVQSTCIFRFSIFESTKVQTHDFYAKSRIWSTKVQGFSSIFRQN